MAYTRGNLAHQTSPQRMPVREKDFPKEVVKKVKRRTTFSTSEKLIYLFMVVFVVSAAMLVSSWHTELYTLNSKIKEKEKEISTLDAGNEALKHEVFKLMSPDRLKKEATRLGMVPANL